MMSKRIRFIVVIVVCSLVGIFLFQGYWLYNSYKLSTQRFEREVTDVVRRLERHYALADMETMGFFADSTSGNDSARLAKMVDLLLSGPGAPPPQLLDNKKLKDRKVITESRVVVTYTDDTAFATRRIHADSALRFRRLLGDSLKLANTGKAGTQLFTINTGYDYTETELAGFNRLLTAELDSLLLGAGIGSPYAVKLSNFSGRGDTYVSDSALFDQHDHAAIKEAKIGVLKPYRLSLAIANDVRYLLKNMLWVLLASVAIVGVTIWAFVAMLRIIFQQKRLSDIKNDFINNMTHEFKTPIATVSLAVEAMQNFDVMSKPVQANEYLDICQHELKRISVMVEKVLKMAAFERLDVRLALQKTDIGKLVRDVVENMRPQWEQKGAKVSIKSNGGVEAMVDRTHISNVIYNLIDNSLKYTEKTPQIDIVYDKTKDSSVRLTVSDNGIGIPAAYQERVFENFFRVPTGNIHNAKGFGLGLGYVAAIVRKHQGRIDVKSAVGSGSTFTVILPMTPQSHKTN